MSETICLNCERTEHETPLITLTFKGETKFICAQCLPTLIHKPYLLVEKLPGMQIAASNHDH
jgi:hypothetical protein